MWYAYRSFAMEETDDQKDLRSRLTELLTPSMTNAGWRKWTAIDPIGIARTFACTRKQWTGMSGW